MPSLRIVSWNSTGESQQKAVELQAVQPVLAGLYPAAPDVDVFLVQEAQQAAGGSISSMLDTDPATPATGVSVGPAYQRPAAHQPELTTGGGAGHICLVHNGVVVNTPLTLWDYATDPALNGWIASLPGHLQATAQTATTHRPPAYAVLTVGGSTAMLITWHAPLGVPALAPGYTMPGNGLIDAYLVMENSGLLQQAQAQVLATDGVVIIAGDLNTTSQGLAANYPIATGYNPLPDFVGFSDNVSHILAWRPSGNVVTVQEGHSTDSSSVHRIISARVSW
ncbi:hypothetical protein [Hyalangium minutum]|uniref:Endonuclease/exonuclease/phosphatase domain-containing protein n=1 Tax=Hyalangium minutum TaxID=394096 RepID=A0A085W9R5_9BACT|nr:hypothetical protein [Hyalangium minutum]KFE64428.1 hypothetical protein DB31_2222 [Hyalangium minutum]